MPCVSMESFRWRYLNRRDRLTDATRRLATTTRVDLFRSSLLYQDDPVASVSRNFDNHHIIIYLCVVCFMVEQHFNIKLVSEIEKHPELYSIIRWKTTRKKRRTICGEYFYFNRDWYKIFSCVFSCCFYNNDKK